MSVKVTIIENGPLIIHNESDEAMTVNDELVGKKIAICRCGKNEIWCDGSHKFKTIEESELYNSDRKTVD
jgi:CDGSH-type Zn-finger protein